MRLNPRQQAVHENCFIEIDSFENQTRRSSDMNTITQDQALEILEKFRKDRYEEHNLTYRSNAMLLVDEKNRIKGVELHFAVWPNINQTMLRVDFVRGGKSIRASGYTDSGRTMFGKYKMTPDEFFALLDQLPASVGMPMVVFDELEDTLKENWD
jgi:hypothetical protein